MLDTWRMCSMAMKFVQGCAATWGLRRRIAPRMFGAWRKSPRCSHERGSSVLRPLCPHTRRIATRRGGLREIMPSLKCMFMRHWRSARSAIPKGCMPRPAPARLRRSLASLPRMKSRPGRTLQWLRIEYPSRRQSQKSSNASVDSLTGSLIHPAIEQHAPLRSRVRRVRRFIEDPPSTIRKTDRPAHWRIRSGNARLGRSWRLDGRTQAGCSQQSSG